MSNTRITTLLQLVLVCAALGTSGCATFATSKSQPLADDILQQHKGDVQGLYNAWIKPQTTVRHQHDGSSVDIMPPTDLDTMEATEAAISKDFERFCSASGGALDVQPQKYGRKNVCNDTSGAYLGEIDTERFQWGLVFTVDSRQARQRQAQAQAQADAAKRREDYAALAPENLRTINLYVLRMLIREFDGDDPQNRLPAANARLAALEAAAAKQAAEQERQRQAQILAAKAARKRAQESRQVGDQVCYVTNDTTLNQPTGLVVLGQEQYRQIHGATRVMGFVEGVNPANGKIQIRISGITFSADGGTQSVQSMENFKDGLTIRVNNVIWDDTHDWDGC